MSEYGTRDHNVSGGRVTTLPGIGRVPRDASPELKRYLETVQETIEVRNGQRGDPKDRAVTLRELIDSGLAKELASTPFDPNNVTDGNRGFTTPTTNTDPETPTAPTSFVVTSGYASISLRWDYPFTYRGHSLTEVWRHTSDSLGNATFIGQSGGTTFVDPIGSGSATQYYWVRHVNDDGIAGPFNANSGTTGTTATDVNVLLSSLSNAITSSQLASSLATPIGNLPANTNASFTAVTNTTNSLGAQYTVKIQTASSGGGTHVAGYGLATEAINGTTTSAFIVAADRFAVVNPANHGQGQNNSDPASSTVPFAVLSAQAFPTAADANATIPAGVYMDSAFINKATISTLLAGSIISDFSRTNIVMDAPHLLAGTINIGSITKPPATSTDPKTWTYGGTNRTSNFSVDATGVMHCQGATIKRQSDGAVVFDATELDGTYIKNLSVHTASIAGNAVTVPSSVQHVNPAGPSYTYLSESTETTLISHIGGTTLEVNYGTSNDQTAGLLPSRVLYFAYVDLGSSGTGGDHAAARVKIYYNTSNSSTITGATEVQAVQVNDRKGAPPFLTISFSTQSWVGARYFFMTIEVLGEGVSATGWWRVEDANLTILGVKK